MSSMAVLFGALGKLCFRHTSMYSTSTDASARVAALGKKLKKMSKLEEKPKLEVETDVNKLVRFLCGANIYIEGGKEIEIKADSEYPDWLWNIHIGKPLPLEKLDPNSREYWNKVRKEGRRVEKRLLKLQKHKTLQK